MKKVSLLILLVLLTLLLYVDGDLGIVMKGSVIDAVPQWMPERFSFWNILNVFGGVPQW